MGLGVGSSALVARAHQQFHRHDEHERREREHAQRERAQRGAVSACAATGGGSAEAEAGEVA